MAVPRRGVTAQVGHASLPARGLPVVTADIAFLLRNRKILMGESD